jgi:hypothetical protein
MPTGVGAWLWPGYDLDASAVVHGAIGHRLSHLIPKFADGTADHPKNGESYHPFVRSLVAAAHAYGIAVHGFPYLYGQSAPEREAYAQAHMALELGLDGVVLDVECEDGSSGYANDSAAARTYMTTFRGVVGENFPIGISTYWRPSWHKSTPLAAFCERATYGSPQTYWAAEVQECLKIAVAEWGALGLPIIPTLGDVDDPHFDASKIAPFSALAHQLGLPAWNLWYWEAASSGEWAAMTAAAEAWTPHPADHSLKVVFNGQVIDCDPAENQGRTLVCLRALWEGTGGTVAYRQMPQGPRIYLTPSLRPSP